MMYPEKERLCAILGLSLQATHEEIIHAYQEQNRIIDTLRPLNSAERDLMEEKRSVLSNAFAAYEEERNETASRSITPIAEAVRRQVGSGSTTMYGFHIPCVICGAFKVMDWFWNCCCAGCSCTGERKEDVCSECYNSGDVCSNGFQIIDTIIAIIGIIVAIVLFIKKFGPSISKAITNSAEYKARKRTEKGERKFDAKFWRQYVPKLKVAYEEWADLRRYNVDIRAFLGYVSKVESSEQISGSFDQMQNVVNAEYAEVEERWGKLQRMLNELRGENDGRYYTHLTSYSGSIDGRYLEMFRHCQKKQPWQTEK